MQNKSFHYALFNKPYGVLSQFTDSAGRRTLADYGPFPKDAYPAGRLDADSEGLVLLTNDGRLKHLLIEPRYRHPRTYLAQVERIPGRGALHKLRRGVIIEGKKTLPVEVALLHVEPRLPPRSVPIRFRKNIPTAWLKLTLYEGRNRQVRKITAAVGHPVLRLVRIAIGPLTLGDLPPGEMRELAAREMQKLRQLIERSSNYRL
ncbi:MAG: pseudouridine synthase [Ignavibacteriae bacterium]|nr:pseudouridine synthase [Ignavibacteria bacterium]MBI3363378.1 pseudouridine synthase [Ignavibacteriota bacterium]